MSWLKIEDLDDRLELVTVSDADANLICGGKGDSRPQNYSLSFSNSTAGAVKVGSNVYNFGTTAGANFNIGSDPSKNGGSVTIAFKPWHL